MILVKLLNLSKPQVSSSINGKDNSIGILLSQMLIEMPYWIKEMTTIDDIKYNFI